VYGTFVLFSAPEDADKYDVKEGRGGKRMNVDEYLEIICLGCLEGMLYRCVVFVLIAYLALIEVGEKKVLLSKGINFFWDSWFAMRFLSFMH